MLGVEIFLFLVDLEVGSLLGERLSPFFRLELGRVGVCKVAFGSTFSWALVLRLDFELFGVLGGLVLG